MEQAKKFVFSRNVIKYLQYNAYFTTCNTPGEKLHNCHYVTTKIVTRPVPRMSPSKQVLSKVFSSSSTSQTALDSITFERVCEETLESLTDYFEQLVEGSETLESGDVSYSGGVLTVYLGQKFGTYVINRQSPNKQIWLSSPTSGPKRYDYVPDGNYWIYRHNGESLHHLLQKEMSEILKSPVDFSKCSYSNIKLGE